MFFFLTLCETTKSWSVFEDSVHVSLVWTEYMIKRQKTTTSSYKHIIGKMSLSYKYISYIIIFLCIIGIHHLSGFTNTNIFSCIHIAVSLIQLDPHQFQSPYHNTIGKKHKKTTTLPKVYYLHIPLEIPGSLFN